MTVMIKMIALIAAVLVITSRHKICQFEKMSGIGDDEIKLQNTFLMSSLDQ